MTKSYNLIQQKQCRHSFPPQKNIHATTSMLVDILPIILHSSSSTTDNTITTCSSPLHGNENKNIYPLTEENLAIHTNDFPPYKDARSRNAQLFVENQRPVIKMELKLEEQRIKEMTSFIPILIQDDTSPVAAEIHFSNPFDQPQAKKNWLKRFTHWIRSDSSSSDKEKICHVSLSAGTEKYHRIDTIICQKRDSGISILNHNGKCRSSSFMMRNSFKNITSIPIVRQPKFSPSSLQDHDEFMAFRYPKMMRKNLCSTSQ